MTFAGVYYALVPFLLLVIAFGEWHRHRLGWATIYFALAIIGFALLAVVR